MLWGRTRKRWLDRALRLEKVGRDCRMARFAAVVISVDYRNPGSLPNFGARLRLQHTSPGNVRRGGGARIYFMSTYSNPFASRTEPLAVLVADDVIEIQQLVQQWLRDLGCLVMCVATGREASRLLRTQHVDIVITDVLMPDGDGLEVIAELRRMRSSARILAISGGGSHLHASDCLKFAKGLGAHGLLMKPFNRRQLLDALGLIFPVTPPPENT